MTYTGNSSNTSSTNSKGHGGPNANRYPRPSYRGPLAPVPWALTLRLPENRISAADAENLLLLVRHQLVMLPGPPTPILPSDAKVDSEATSIPTNKPAGGSGYLEELDISHNNLRVRRSCYVIVFWQNNEKIKSSLVCETGLASANWSLVSRNKCHHSLL